MQRCLQLALLGLGNVAPNPMVGAVLVYNNKIIGEGYHQKFGEAHAEVNCINNVAEENKHLINQSTLYVSLEPCSHFGKTPPCVDLIISNKIPKVVIACKDNYIEVNGRGIEKLKLAGVNVIEGVLENEAKELNKQFFYFNKKQRPYVILKWAQSSDDKIALADYSKVSISNEYTNRIVHKWRSEEAAIMVGYNTALHDNPSLTTRLWHGNNATRVVIDKNLRLPLTHHLFDSAAKTIIFNNSKDVSSDKIVYSKLNVEDDVLQQILDELYQLKIQSIIIEGGASLLQSFINANYWNEARVITNQQMVLGSGIAAPILSNHQLINEEKYYNDTIQYFINKQL